MTIPRIEQAYFPSYTFNVSIASAQAYLSATASGMMALSGIIFSMAFVMVQFSAIAYSPRLALWYARDRTLFHALGCFIATFVYSLITLAWVDRAGSGSVPFFSSVVVAVMLVVSMLLFARLVQRLGDLQITNVLHLIGDQGRKVIDEMFYRSAEVATGAQADAGTVATESQDLGPVAHTLKYSGAPRTVAKFDIVSLVQMAKRAGGVIVLKCAVGDTLVQDALVLQLHGAGGSASDHAADAGDPS